MKQLRTQRQEWHAYIEEVQRILGRGTDIHESTVMRRCFTNRESAQRAAEKILGNPQLLGG